MNAWMHGRLSMVEKCEMIVCRIIRFSLFAGFRWGRSNAGGIGMNERDSRPKPTIDKTIDNVTMQIQEYNASKTRTNHRLRLEKPPEFPAAGRFCPEPEIPPDSTRRTNAPSRIR